MTLTDPAATARAIADQTAGATLAELRAQADVASRAVDAWLSAFEAALAAQPRTLEPPLTIAQAAKALAVSDWAIREWLRLGKLRQIPGFDSPIRIERAELVRFSLGRTATAAAAD